MKRLTIKKIIGLLSISLLLSSCADQLLTEKNKSNTCTDACCGMDCNYEPLMSVTDEKCISGDGYVNISWTNPFVYPYPTHILVLRKANSIVNPPGGMGVNPGSPFDPFAEVVYFGPATNFIQDLEVMNHTWYHYGIWTATQVGIDASGEPIYEYSPQGSFCQAYPCYDAPDDTDPDPIDDPVVITPGDGAICLDWQLPADADVTGVRVYRSLMPFVGEPKDDPNAVIIFEGTGTDLVDAQVINENPYYYAIYTINSAGVLSATAVSVSETPTSILPTPEEVVKLTASDAQSFDEYGHSTDIQGNLMIVGAYGAEVSSVGSTISNAGAAYIYERTINSPLTASDDVWTEVQILNASDPRSNAQFGEEVFISADQDLIIVGANRGVSDSNFVTGSVYIFEKNAANQWTETQKLTPTFGGSEDDFGAEFEYSKDANGNEVLAVGAQGADSNLDENIGRVFIFEKQGGVWVETAVIYSPSNTDNFYFGGEIESSEGQVAVSGGDQVFILDKVNGAWIIDQTISGSNTVVGDNFGHEISIDNNIMAISANAAHNIDPALSNAGAVYMFAKDANGVWVEQQIIYPSNPQSYNSFGEDIDLSGNLLAVGTDQYDSITGYEGTINTGMIHIFRFDGSSWNELGALSMSDAQDGDRAGEEVRISGTTLIVGASEENGGPGNPITGAGAAYVFDITSIVNLCVAPPSPLVGDGGTITGTYNSTPLPNPLAGQASSGVTSGVSTDDILRNIFDEDRQK